jgi:exonuclease VII small subunit
VSDTATRASSTPAARGPWIAALLVVAVGSFWLGHRQGQRAAGYDAAAGARERRALESEVARLESANSRLNTQVAEFEMARRLDREAYGQVERTLGDLQSRLARQGDDLAFYRSIVSPADGVQGLRIQRFAVRPGTQPREFVIEVTLIQAMRQDSTASGLAQLVIQGMEGARPTRYSVGQLLGRPHAQLPFSFRYFQTLERAVTLPDGFQPFEVEVSVQSGRLRSPLRQSFPWKVTNAANAEEVSPSDPPRGSVR